MFEVGFEVVIIFLFPCCRVKEHSAQQLASLSVDHKRELEILRGRHALEHSTSKVAELTNQVSSHEVSLTEPANNNHRKAKSVMIQHFKISALAVD